MAKIASNYPRNIIEQLGNNPSQAFYAELGISYLGVFGSVARGDDKSTSDIDLLIDFTETKTLFDLARIKHSFERILGKKVDLVLKRSVKKNLVPYIEKDLITIYEPNNKA